MWRGRGGRGSWQVTGISAARCRVAYRRFGWQARRQACHFARFLASHQRRCLALRRTYRCSARGATELCLRHTYKQRRRLIPVCMHDTGPASVSVPGLTVQLLALVETRELRAILRVTIGCHHLCNLDTVWTIGRAVESEETWTSLAGCSMILPWPSEPDDA